MKTLIIAEAGVNHNGDLDTARQLVRTAADCGADIVKFQTFNAALSVAATAPLAGYQARALPTVTSQLEMIRRLELDVASHRILVEECENVGIGFMSTAFDEPSFLLLIELGVSMLKVPSGEITNLPMLRLIGSSGLPVLLSTGMSTLGEVETALHCLEQSGTDPASVVVLQCNTEYPTPFEDANLRAMVAMRDGLGVRVGYSDHTLGIEATIAAAAMGAEVIEKHLTLSRSADGPDHRASLEPAEFALMVSCLRNIEKAMGDGKKRPTCSETANREVARKSIVASRDIREGEVFTALNLAAKRPGSGISPMLWDDVIGRKASRNFQCDELIEL